MSLQSTDVPAASGKRQHVWALHVWTPLLPQQTCRRGHCSVSKHTSEPQTSYTWPWFNGACRCVCSVDWYVARMWLRSGLQCSSVWQRGWQGVMGGGRQSAQSKVTCVCPCSTLEAALTFGSPAWQRLQSGGRMEATKAASVATIDSNDPLHPPKPSQYPSCSGCLMNFTSERSDRQSKGV